MNDQKISEILLLRNYVSQSDLSKAKVEAKKNNTTITNYLLAQGLLTRDLLGQAVAESFGITYADLNSNPPKKEQVLRIPDATAKTYRIVLFSEDEKTVTIATDRPSQTLLKYLATLFPGKKIILAYSLPKDIESSFLYYKKPLQTRFAEVIKTQKKIAPEIIGQLFEDALAFNASDIHMEPGGAEVVFRFRIDGVLHEAGRVSKENYENILNKIKILGHMRIDEHLSSQDGAIRYAGKNGNVDMRVSIVPIFEGEKIAIRIFSSYVRGLTLTDIGLSPADQGIIRNGSRKPFGMILATGPTGSGKTTTLYALMKILNKPEINITTIEDPIEYIIRGVNQIQVNRETNLTFSKGLKSIIRQNPDIILVGEIRDRETAEIAVNAALAGHLLFSTFHANDAATAIPRLLEMGIEPFLLSSTLDLIVAQRLVRTICQNCRVSESVGGKTVYKGKGCGACGGSGYKGRTAIFEIIELTQNIKDLILTNPSSAEIWNLAKANGARSLYDDGLLKVGSGVTTLEELLRVASGPTSKHGE